MTKKTIDSDSFDLSFEELSKFNGTRVVIQETSSSRSNYKIGTLVQASPKRFYLELPCNCNEEKMRKILLKKGHLIRLDSNGGKPYRLY